MTNKRPKMLWATLLTMARIATSVLPNGKKMLQAKLNKIKSGLAGAVWHLVFLSERQ